MLSFQTPIARLKWFSSLFAWLILVVFLPAVGHATTNDFEFHLTATGSNPNLPTIISGTIHYDSALANIGSVFHITTISNTADADAGTQLYDIGGNLIFGAGAVALGGSTLVQSNLLFSYGLDPTDPTSKEILYLSDAGGALLPSPGHSVGLTNCIMYAQDSSGAISGSGQYYSGTISNINTVPMPVLTFTIQSRQLITAWPTNFTGFTLQYATNLPTPLWAMVTTTPVVVDQQFTVTNPITVGIRFFRLMQ